MIVGIIIGVVWAISLVVAFMVGYGFGDMRYRQTQDEEEELP